MKRCFPFSAALTDETETSAIRVAIYRFFIRNIPSFSFDANVTDESFGYECLKGANKQIRFSVSRTAGPASSGTQATFVKSALGSYFPFSVAALVELGLQHWSACTVECGCP